jgi:hypothetical protein
MVVVVMIIIINKELKIINIKIVVFNYYVRVKLIINVGTAET